MLNDNALAQENAQLKCQLDAANETILFLREKIHLLNLRQFSPRSEAHLLQQNLFDELGVADSDSKPHVDNDTVEITYTRQRKPTRKALPKNLTHIDTLVDIDEADKVCACGCTKVQMGEKISEQLDIIPAKVQVLRTIRPQYVCKSCDSDAISIAKLPQRLLPKSMLSEGALAHILVAKYVDHMPLYRQSVYWSRQGIDLPRNTLCDSLMKIYDRLEPIAKLLQEACLETKYLQVDETVVQVLNEDERANQQKSYLWVYRGGSPQVPITYYLL